MKSVQIYRYGSKEVMQVNPNTSKPNLSSGKLLIKVLAAGVNPIDWKVREGMFQTVKPLRFPATLGMDFSGVVEDVGENVHGFKKGDEVYGQSNYFNDDTGAFAEFIVVSSETCAIKPKNISHLQAAALPLAAISAWQALVDYMKISKGDKILIHGGAGGIGVFAIQIAKYLGAYVATTVSSSSQKFVKELGADEVIDYKNQTFEKLLNNYDAVFDNVGGDVYLNSFKILKPGGLIVSMLEKPCPELMEKYKVQSIVEFTEVNCERLSKLTDLIDKNIIKIPIDKVFSLNQAAEALDYLQHGHPQGKVVVSNYV
jgi:alcohol dehydrogenase